ncbi:hypothetical protein [Paenibacillus assamensis]|uniref:hypothetical protein n=1 Tax=Paenibacillus assamensis TaxID=311244 RepID=UPI000428B3E2|nr:hypothetical protein [Paenibacillus assamensis]
MKMKSQMKRTRSLAATKPNGYHRGYFAIFAHFKNLTGVIELIYPFSPHFSSTTPQ